PSAASVTSRPRRPPCSRLPPSRRRSCSRRRSWRTDAPRLRSRPRALVDARNRRRARLEPPPRRDDRRPPGHPRDRRRPGAERHLAARRRARAHLRHPARRHDEGVMSHVPLAWFLARASGLVAFGLLTLSMWLGLAMSTRLLGTRRQKALLGWHRTLVWTGLSMIGLHLISVLADPTLHFGLAAVLVPFAAPWHPGAIAAGIVAGWLMLMLALSFRARKWIGARGWRALHYASFLAFALV